MKVHKKILTHYLSCTSPVDKEGYLYKKKERNASYQRRWFVLKANLLFYQERPADRHLLGVIVLEGCAVHHNEFDGEFTFSVAFQGPGLKTYRFAAEDRLTQESWVKALLAASHCYLSTLVRDLGRQYEEAKREQSSGESRNQDPSSACVLTGKTPGPSSGPPLQSPGSCVSPAMPRAMARGGRCHGNTSHILQTPSVPTKVSNKKSPKLWPRRNAYVTPLNGPAPLYGEWPPVGLDPLEEFSRLHEHYGQEVIRARDEWLKTGQVKKEESVDDLIDLG